MNPFQILRAGPCLAAFCLASSVLLAGCADGGPSTLASPSAPALDEGASEPVTAAPWQIAGAAEATYVAAAGVPYDRIVWQGGCAFIEFTVPVDATRLDVSLAGQIVDAHRGGAGAMTFMMRPEGGEWLPANHSPGTTGASLKQDMPVPAVWQVWAWPEGPVVNQSWTLSVHVEGVGPPPSPLVPAAAC